LIKKSAVKLNIDRNQNIDGFITPIKYTKIITPGHNENHPIIHARYDICHIYENLLLIITETRLFNQLNCELILVPAMLMINPIKGRPKPA